LMARSKKKAAVRPRPNRNHPVAQKKDRPAIGCPTINLAETVACRRNSNPGNKRILYKDGMLRICHYKIREVQNRPKRTRGLHRIE
jgi:hypothetical protein